jgi:PAS domain-containing protein
MPSDTFADDSKAGPGTAAVLEAIPQPVWVCDEAGVIQSQNQKAGALTENMGDVQCRSIGELIEYLSPREARSRLQKVLDDLSNSEPETSCEFRLDPDCALPASMYSDDRWNHQRPTGLELKARLAR